MLTRKQTEILAVIRNHISLNAIAPTLHELCTAMGTTSVGTMSRHLLHLTEKGHIRRAGRSWRNMALSNACPFCGCSTTAAPSAVHNIPDIEKEK